MEFLCSFWLAISLLLIRLAGKSLFNLTIFPCYFWGKYPSLSCKLWSRSSCLWLSTLVYFTQTSAREIFGHLLRNFKNLRNFKKIILKNNFFNNLYRSVRSNNNHDFQSIMPNKSSYSTFPVNQFIRLMFMNVNVLFCRMVCRTNVRSSTANSDWFGWKTRRIIL